MRTKAHPCRLLRRRAWRAASRCLVAGLLVLSGVSASLADIEVLERERFPFHDALAGGCLTADTGPSTKPGTFDLVPGTYGAAVAAPRVITYRVAVEQGLPVDAPCFAELVDHILAHANGWTRTERFAFRRVAADEPASAVITLAAPGTVDRRCHPLRTNGFFSCWNGARAMINFRQWSGKGRFRGADLRLYRAYLINHEMGHRLGFVHRRCPRRGQLAPVMMQQTKGVGSCRLNAWPTADELPGDS